MSEQSYYFYANPYQPQSAEAAKQMKEVLEKRGGKVYAPFWMSSFMPDASFSDQVPAFCRAAVAFGGDGTLLRLAPLAAESGVPMLGVHTGHVGFLMTGSPDKIEEIAALLTENKCAVNRYPLLKVAAMGKTYTALNDVSISRGNHPGILVVDVQVNGEKVYAPHGDGIILSTPLGSTAYSMAAGGPIMHPLTQGLILTPICSREMLSRPVVLPLKCRVDFSVPPLPRDEARLSVDGQTNMPLPGGCRVEVTPADRTADILTLGPLRFFETLRRKTALWNEYS